MAPQLTYNPHPPWRKTLQKPFIDGRLPCKDYLTTAIGSLHTVLSIPGGSKQWMPLPMSYYIFTRSLSPPRSYTPRMPGLHLFGHYSWHLQHLLERNTWHASPPLSMWPSLQAWQLRRSDESSSHYPATVTDCRLQNHHPPSNTHKTMVM